MWFSSESDKTLLCTSHSPTSPSTWSIPNSLRLEPLGWKNIIIHGGEACEKGYKSALRRQTPFGWIPASQSNATFDAIMCTDLHIITFQVMVAAKHNMKEEAFKTLQTHLSRTFQNRRHWIHIFATDCRDTAAKLRRETYMIPKGMKILIYTAVLENFLFKFTCKDLERIRTSVSKKILFIYFVTYVGH